MHTSDLGQGVLQGVTGRFGLCRGLLGDAAEAGVLLLQLLLPTPRFSLCGTALRGVAPHVALCVYTILSHTVCTRYSITPCSLYVHTR